MSGIITFCDVEPKLSEATLQGIALFGFSFMTPVQAATIPLFLKNKDVCVEATTGSGKTLAFGIPIFEILRRSSEGTLRKHEVGALVVAPTRELASQIFEVLSKLSSHHVSFRCALLVGGTSIQDCVKDFESNGANVVVGTPGRIVDLRNRCPILSFNKLEVLILDEADTLLDMGFRETINQILSFLPKQRRTGLFSATQTKEVKDLARAGMRNPVSLSVKVLSAPTPSSTTSNASVLSYNENSSTQVNTQASSSVTPSTLENFYCISEYDERPARLIEFICQHETDKMIIFCATCACVDYFSTVFSRLSKKSIFLPKSLPVVGFHGRMPQKKRNIVYKKFVSLDRGIMFSTDVAARGVDIPEVDWVVQLAAPKDPAFFVHRVGRTARAGRRGGSLLFVSEKEIPYVALLAGRGVQMTEKNVMPRFIDEDNQGTTEPTPRRCVNDDHENFKAEAAGDQSENDGDENEEDDVEEEADADDIDENDESTVNSDAAISGTTVEQGETPATSSQSTGTANASATVSVRACASRVFLALRCLAVEDRAVLEAGSTAFMSFLRSYQEHLCSYIFKFGELDIGSVAREYALLRLPKIPETRGLRGAKIQFETSDVNTSTIKYQHKEREEARVRRLERAQVAKQDEVDGAGAGAYESMSVSGGDSVKSTKSGKSQWVPPEQYVVPEDPKRVRVKKRSKQQLLMDEWAEFSAEEQAFRKFKKGKVSREMYESCLMAEEAPELDSDTGVVKLGGHVTKGEALAGGDGDDHHGLNKYYSDGDDAAAEAVSETASVKDCSKQQEAPSRLQQLWAWKSGVKDGGGSLKKNKRVSRADKSRSAPVTAHVAGVNNMPSFFVKRGGGRGRGRGGRGGRGSGGASSLGSSGGTAVQRKVSELLNKRGAGGRGRGGDGECGGRGGRGEGNKRSGRR